MGLKKWLFGGETVSEKAQKVLKDNKIPVVIKYQKIKDIYAKYFYTTIDVDAKMALWENHYEKLVKNNILQKDQYNKYLKIETENLAFCYSFTLCRQFSQLLNMGLKIKDLPDIKFAYDVLKLTECCNFNNQYDGTQFYINEQHRSNIIKHINDFVENCKKQYNQKQDMTL